MRQRVPPILKHVEAVKARLQHEKWRAERSSYGNTRTVERRRQSADANVKHIEAIEEWVRGHIPEEEWKGFIG